MFNWLKNRSIAFRVYILAAAAVAGVLMLYATYYFTNVSIGKSQAQSEFYNEVGMKVSDLESELLQLRRHEKDFLLRRDNSYVKAYQASSSRSEQLVDELLSMSTNDEMQQEVSDVTLREATALKTIIIQHRQQFAKVVDGLRTLGYDEESGLQGQLRGSVHEIEDILKAPENNLDSLWRLMLMMRRHEKDFIMRVAPKYIDRFNQRQDEFKVALEKAGLSDETGKQILERLDAYRLAFTAYSDRRLTFAGNVDALSEIYQGVDPRLAALKEVSMRYRSQAIAMAAKTEEQGFLQLTVIGIIVALVAAIISRMVTSAIVGPVKQLENSLKIVADGNYDVEIPGTEFADEIGTMAKVAEKLKISAKERLELEMKALKEVTAKADQEREEAARRAEERERMMEDDRNRARIREERAQRLDRMIRDFDRKIAGAMGELAGASGKMRHTAEVMVNVADATGRQSVSVREASGEMQHNTNSMLAAIEEFSASIREVNSQVQTAGAISGEAVETSHQGGAAISQLSESSRQIEDVVNLINDIAEQTNLLALNATIEAARAGDAGRGFAVVASEVKSLATQTATATNSITDRIQTMQSVTETAVGAIESIGKTIDSLNEIMVSITAAVEQQQATTDEINRSVQYTSQGTDKVASEIEQVSHGAEQTGSESANVMSAAENLDSLSAMIKSEVDHFLTDVRQLQTEMEAQVQANQRPEADLRVVETVAAAE